MFCVFVAPLPTPTPGTRLWVAFQVLAGYLLPALPLPFRPTGSNTHPSTLGFHVTPPNPSFMPNATNTPPRCVCRVRPLSHRRTRQGRGCHVRHLPHPNLYAEHVEHALGGVFSVFNGSLPFPFHANTQNTAFAPRFGCCFGYPPPPPP